MIANVLLIPEIYDCHTSSFSPILLSDRKNNSFDATTDYIQEEQTNYALLLVVDNNLCSFLIYDLSADL
jgi:hypothetical protein